MQLHRQYDLPIYLSAKAMHLLHPFIQEAWRTEMDIGSGDTFVVAELQNMENALRNKLQHVEERLV